MASSEEEDWAGSLLDASDVEALKRAWRNEKLAPELLAFQADLVERVREQIKLAEDNLTALAAESTDELTLSLYRIDVNRTFFLLRSYLRTRLEKIDKYAFHTIANGEIWAKLSDKEQDYAERYVDALEKHMRDSILDKLPEGYEKMVQQSSSSRENDMIVEPSLDTFVFCKCKTPVGTLQLDDRGEEIVDMAAGDLYILHYKPVKRLLETDAIELH